MNSFLLIKYQFIFVIFVSIGKQQNLVPHERHYKVDIIIILLNVTCSCHWYSWKMAHLASNHNHSLTHSLNFCCYTDIEMFFDICKKINNVDNIFFNYIEIEITVFYFNICWHIYIYYFMTGNTVNLVLLNNLFLPLI
jgi:hypothetical protein